MTGEIRQVAGAEKILKEAARLGFKQAMVPKAALKLYKESKNGKNGFGNDQLKVTGIELLLEAFNTIIPNWQKDLQNTKRSGKESSALK